MGYNIKTNKKNLVITTAKISENMKNQEMNLNINREKYRNRSTIFDIFNVY